MTKLVNSAIVKVISSDHFQLSFSGPIESKVEKLTQIVIAQCLPLNQLKEDIKVLKDSTQQLLVENKKKEERRF